MWKVFSASAIGKHHLDLGLPCQDAFAFRTANDSLVAVVCDGAGSARNSDIGATTCSVEIAERIAVRLTGGDCSAPIGEEDIAAAVDAARSKLELLASDRQLELRELACTVVGAILFPAGGWLFHIGDGLAVAETLTARAEISSPENGEYANETYFVTAADWRSSLRIQPISEPVGLLALMSDGAMPFVMNRDCSDMFAPFIDPVRTYLLGVTEQDGSDALQATLADERTWSITGDDKTLLLAMPA